MKLGQEIWVKPGIWGFGYYTPSTKGEKFRLRQSIWNYGSWFYLGILTDTDSPDLENGSSASFLEYKDSFGTYKYILKDDSLETGLEFHDQEGPLGEISAEVIKEKSDSLPWYKQYLGSIVAGVLAAGSLVIYFASKGKKKNPLKK